MFLWATVYIQWEPSCSLLMDGQTDQHNQARTVVTFISCVANMSKNDKLCGTSPEHSYCGVHSVCLGHAWAQSLRFWAQVRPTCPATVILHQVINNKSTQITCQNKQNTTYCKCKSNKIMKRHV